MSIPSPFLCSDDKTSVIGVSTWRTWRRSAKGNSWTRKFGQARSSATAQGPAAVDTATDQGPADQGPADQGPADQGPADQGTAVESAPASPSCQGPAAPTTHTRTHTNTHIHRTRSNGSRSHRRRSRTPPRLSPEHRRRRAESPNARTKTSKSARRTPSKRSTVSRYHTRTRTHSITPRRQGPIDVAQEPLLAFRQSIAVAAVSPRILAPRPAASRTTSKRSTVSRYHTHTRTHNITPHRVKVPSTSLKNPSSPFARASPSPR